MIALVVIAVVAALVLVFGMSTIRELMGNDEAMQREQRRQDEQGKIATANAEKLDPRNDTTLAKYQQLNTGMSYPEVVLAIGSEGNESNRYVGTGGAVVVTFTWDGYKGGSAVLTFADQYLTAMPNSGLK